MKRILCVATTGMGNVLLYLPVVRTLRKRYPDAVIDLLVSSLPAQELLSGMAEVNSVILFNKRQRSLVGVMTLLRSLRRSKYDIFVTSYLDKSFKVALMGWMLNIPVRVGFEKGFSGMLYTHRVRETGRKHEVEYNLDLMRAIGITDVRTDIALTLSREQVVRADERIPGDPLRRRIGFHPGSGTDLGLSVKRWGVNKFALLADRLAEKMHADVFIFGGPEERSLADAMAAAMKTKPHILVGESITMTAALIARCGLFVSNDSGLMHLAAAVQAPVVGIFGPTLWWKNYPWEASHVVVRSRLHCAPCYRFFGISCRDQKCLLGISVDDVFSQAVLLLGNDGR
jgi:heptosyltransferase-2